MQIAPVALISDFGNRDWYVGTMKAVIASLCPDQIPPFLDISHEIDQGDIVSAAFVCDAILPWLPKQSTLCAVVDPGVGTKRDIVVGSLQDRYFVGPDNGIFTYLAQRPGCRFWKINDPFAFSKEKSTTFHGRDCFAPYTAKLHLQKDPAAFGSPCTSIVQLPLKRFCQSSGEIIYFDHFGNAITNLCDDAKHNTLDLAGIGAITMHPTFALGPENQPFAIVGSSNTIEVVRKNDSARLKDSLQIGQIIRFI